MTLETAFDLPFWFEFAATVTGGLSGGMSAVRAATTSSAPWPSPASPAWAAASSATSCCRTTACTPSKALGFSFPAPWAGVAVFYFGKLATYLDPIVDLLDNISVALWAIIGASKSLSAGLTVIPSVVLGTITSIGGASPATCS